MQQFKDYADSVAIPMSNIILTIYGHSGGGFIVSRAIGIAFPPLGIALAAVSLLGWLFSDSKEEKIRKAKKKLREDLTTPGFDMLNKMHNQVVETFDKDILSKGVDEFVALLGDYAHMLARLGKSQSDMARKLFS